MSSCTMSTDSAVHLIQGLEGMVGPSWSPKLLGHLGAPNYWAILEPQIMELNTAPSHTRPLVKPSLFGVGVGTARGWYRAL